MWQPQALLKLPVVKRLAGNAERGEPTEPVHPSFGFFQEPSYNGHRDDEAVWKAVREGP